MQTHGPTQTMGLSGAVSRSEAAVKAFSGKGQTLGSRPENVRAPSPNDVCSEIPSLERTVTRAHLLSLYRR